MEMTAIDRLYARITVSGKLADGTPAVISSISVAAIPPRTRPDSNTAWTAASVSGGVATVLVAGPAADPAGAIPIPAAGADLWIRIIDGPEVEAVKADRITIISS
jgi:hypothetical protein